MRNFARALKEAIATSKRPRGCLHNAIPSLSARAKFRKSFLTYFLCIFPPREVPQIVFPRASPGSTYHEVKGQPAQVPDTRKQKASQPRIQIPESQGPASARSRFQEVKGHPRFQMPGIQGQASPDSSCQKVRGQPAQVPGSNPKSDPDLAQI